MEPTMNPNELPQDIRDAIHTLSEAILADPQAKPYYSALAAMENDKQVSTLERRFMDLYAELSTRQLKGDQLSEKEVQPFYALRNEYSAHPLIAARNEAIGVFKPLLAEAGELISQQIGLDFTKFAHSA
jgi:cell fate (sporulation/competence/biofilm development) regulator YlbF (YheA/YmcA/DUF963 family)